MPKLPTRSPTHEEIEISRLASMGLEIEEIAEQLGIDRNAVDQRLSRGHAKLREAIGG